jgi:hypothetical protein
MRTTKTRRRKTMSMTKYKLPVATNGAGTGSAVTPEPCAGEVCSIYVDLGTLENTTDLTITVNDGDGALPVLALTNATTGWYYPVVPAVHYSGASHTPKTDGYIPVVGYITATIAQGGASKAGSVYLFVEE